MLENPVTWVYLTFALVGVVVILALVLVVGYIILKPVIIPYMKCRGKVKTPLLAIFQRNGRVRLTKGKYVAEVYEDPDPNYPLAFFKSNVGGYKLGDCDIEVFYDGAAAATSPDLVVAVQELRNMGYQNIDDVMRDVRAGKFKGDCFKLQGEEVCFRKGTISIPLIRQFDPAAVEVFSKGKPAITKAYSDTKLNIERASLHRNFYENPQIMGLAFLIIAGCLGIGILKALGVF